MATLDDYDFDNMSSIDLIEDIENKMEDLIEEKIEIVVNLFKLRFTEGIDNESYMNILSFMHEVMQEATNEQIVLNKLYDYLFAKLEEYGYEKLEHSRLFLEYVSLLSYFDEVEENRFGEYMSYVEKIGQLLRVDAVSPSYLESHRKYTELDKDKTNQISERVPVIKK